MRFAAVSVLWAVALACAATAGELPVVYKSPSCDCCSKWVDHMRSEGITLASKDVSRGTLNRLKAGMGLKPEHAACHTAIVEGYVIEGHVPASDVKRLLSERPEAIGLAVPGMPIGSPGMETGDEKEPFDVLLVKKDGTTEVFSKH